jgi:pimeloyl-ACP methyl ester carboxylesterase
VLDVMDAMHLDRVMLVGQGAGGELAWLIAAQAPQRVERLVLVDAMGYPDTPSAWPLGLRLAQTPGLRSLGSWLLPRALVASTLRDEYAEPDHLDPQTTERVYSLLLRQGNRQALIDMLAQREPIAASDARVPTLRVPSLLLWGQQDSLSPPSVAQAWARHLTQVRVVILDKVGHLPQEEAPAQSAAAVQSFLSP